MSRENEILNFFNPVFWGVANENAEEFVSLIKRASEMTNAFHFSDNMFVFQRNNSMLYDDHFMKVWKDNCISRNDTGIIWRRYIKVILGYHAMQLDGDFVECGAYQGVGAKTVIDYLGGKNFSKTFWLYDIFEHDQTMVNHAMPDHSSDLHLKVQKHFAGYDNVKIFKGLLPEVLEEGSPKKIAYLHIDLNQAPAEIATLEALFDRVVPGGAIILDDYEMRFYRAQKLAEDAWFSERNYKVLPLPTSQGILFKR